MALAVLDPLGLDDLDSIGGFSLEELTKAASRFGVCGECHGPIFDEYSYSQSVGGDALIDVAGAVGTVAWESLKATYDDMEADAMEVHGEMGTLDMLMRPGRAAGKFWAKQTADIVESAEKLRLGVGDAADVINVAAAPIALIAGPFARYGGRLLGRFVRFGVAGSKGGSFVLKSADECAEIAVRMGRSSDEAVEGIYVFTGQTGRTYVGQSGDISRRLKQHLKSGKLPPKATVEIFEVAGGKFEREIAEQLKINSLGGVGQLENIVNPLGPGRIDQIPAGHASAGELLEFLNSQL